MLLYSRYIKVLFIVFILVSFSEASASDSVDNLCLNQTRSPEPNTYCTFNHLNEWGPKLLSSFSAHLELECTGILCQFPIIFKSYLHEDAFINSQEQDGGVLTVEQKQPEDYPATNFSWGPFTEEMLQSKIVNSLIKQELARVALQRLLDKFIIQINSWSGNQPLSTRHVETPIAKAYLGARSPLARFSIFQNSMSCVAGEFACVKRKQEYSQIYNFVISEVSDEVLKTFDRVENYQPHPWLEAENLRSVYHLNQVLNKIHSLSVNDLVAIIQNYEKVSRSNSLILEYKKLILEITARPKNLSDRDSIRLYRNIVELEEIVNLLPSNRISAADIKLEDPNLYQFKINLKNHVNLILNQIGVFYQEREDAINR